MLSESSEKFLDSIKHIDLNMRDVLIAIEDLEEVMKTLRQTLNNFFNEYVMCEVEVFDADKRPGTKTN